MARCPIAAYANAILNGKYLRRYEKRQNIQVPADVPVKFGQACNAKAQGLVDKVWTRNAIASA